MKALREVPHFVLRIVLVWLLDAVALFVLSEILPGVSVTDFGVAVVVAAVIGLVNGLVWPLVIRFALPVAVLTLGFGSLVLNGLVILLASSIDVGLRIDGLGTAIIVALGLTLITTLVTSLLSIDDESVWTRNVVRRSARRNAGTEADGRARPFFLEIDGLGHDLLQRAIRDGHAPTLARWLSDGSHRLLGWETGWSSQTGACQAGLLHGNDFDYPAFRWWRRTADGRS